MDQQSIDLSTLDVPALQDLLQRINYKVGKQAEEAFSTIMGHVIKRGITPRLALKIDDNTMEAMYTQGYNLYNQGKYDEASHMFRLLTLLDFSTPKYLLGLAASFHRLENYYDAATYYLLCGLLDKKNPLPHYHAADCYLKLNEPNVAASSLAMAIHAAGDQPEYEIVKQRARLMGDNILKQRAEGTTPTSDAEAPEDEGEEEEV